MSSLINIPCQSYISANSTKMIDHLAPLVAKDLFDRSVGIGWIALLYSQFTKVSCCILCSVFRYVKWFWLSTCLNNKYADMDSCFNQGIHGHVSWYVNSMEMSVNFINFCSHCILHTTWYFRRAFKMSKHWGISWSNTCEDPHLQGRLYTQRNEWPRLLHSPGM